MSNPCTSSGGRHLEIHVALEGGNLIFTDESGNPATDKLVSHCDFLRWCTTAARLEFDFPNGHPFEPDPLPVTSPGCGNIIRVRYTSPVITKYSVTATDFHGTRHTVDPKVIIDSGLRPKAKTVMKVFGVTAAIVGIAIAVATLAGSSAMEREAE